MSQVTLGGNPIDVAGTFPTPGQQAPAFTLVGKTLTDVKLTDFAGKRKVLNIVPSLDTPTCATSTRRFNEAAGKLDNTVVLVISGDLPFAASRFCTTENLDNVITLSTFRDPSFRSAYGVDVTSGPLTGPDRARGRRARRGRQGPARRAGPRDQARAGLRRRTRRAQVSIHDVPAPELIEHDRFRRQDCCR